MGKSELYHGHKEAQRGEGRGLSYVHIHLWLHQYSDRAHSKYKQQEVGSEYIFRHRLDSLNTSNELLKKQWAVMVAFWTAGIVGIWGWDPKCAVPGEGESVI